MVPHKYSKLNVCTTYQIGTKESVQTTTKAPVFVTDSGAEIDILEICRNATIDAITRTDDGITYVFKGKVLIFVSE